MMVTAVLFCDHDGFEGSTPGRQPGHGWLLVSALCCRRRPPRGQQISDTMLGIPLLVSHKYNHMNSAYLDRPRLPRGRGD